MCASVISLFGLENESKFPKTVQLISELWLITYLFGTSLMIMKTDTSLTVDT